MSTPLFGALISRSTEKEVDGDDEGNTTEMKKNTGPSSSVEVVPRRGVAVILVQVVETSLLDL